MENTKISSIKTILQKDIQNQDHQDEIKFKKIQNQCCQFQNSFEKLKTFQTTVHHLNQIEGQIFKTLNVVASKCFEQPQKNIKVGSIHQSRKLSVKVIPQIQRQFVTLHLTRSKSQHKNIKSSKRNYSGKIKTAIVTKFSNKIIESATSLQEQSYQKQQNYQHKRILSFHANKDQNTIKKSVYKRVKLRTNSVLGNIQPSIQNKKNNQCIPLQNFRIRQQDSFLQNTYRLRKGQIPVWYEISKMWNAAEQKKKTIIRNAQATKQNRKTVYQGYDFNGQLIPAANHNSKNKKYTNDIPQTEVEFFNEDQIQNLTNYHDRQQRYARTVKKIKIIPEKQNNAAQQSCFLDNFQKVSWNKNIDCIKIKQEPQKEENQQVNIQNNEKSPQNHNVVRFQQTDKKCQSQKKIDNQTLIEEFQKVKNISTFNGSQQNIQRQNFNFGFSKYIKVKKFHQKQKKSKSYNYHTHNYFATVQKQTETNIVHELKIMTPQKKGHQKIRANKRLFKQVFSTSLKFIQPQNREDIVTIKMIKNSQNKQNKQVSSKINQQKNQKQLKRIRNSDTALLKKGIQYRPSLFKKYQQESKLRGFKVNKIDQNAEEEGTFDSGKEQIMQVKTQNLINDRCSQKRNQTRFSLIKSGPLVFQSSKKNNSSRKNSQVIIRNSHNNNDLEKIFKKSTQVRLSKHSITEVRQTFI